MLSVLPQPRAFTLTPERSAFTFSSETALCYEGLPSSLTDDFQDFLLRAFHCWLGTQGKNAISLTLEQGDEASEAYSLEISGEEVRISAMGEAGLFYGLQTLKQLLLQTQGTLPACRIEDAPRFPWRAFMLDSGRYFFPVEQIKRFLDQMALHKLNIFHWHLTEDQGWRVEIKRYPRLTQHGSRRSHTNFGVRPHGGFYTHEQVREIVAYAHSKYIKVVPEIDMPGHMVSAIACYPELSCFNRKLPVATHWGVKHDILCAGKEGTYQFIYNVLDEIAGLFPDGYLHIGGDEAVKMRWKLCPECQTAMRKHGLKDEEELQQFFMSTVSRYLKEKGIASIMWNWDSVEATEWLDRDIIWQMCGLPQNTRDEIEKGRRMVFSPSFHFYLDLPYGWNSLEKTYGCVPEIPHISHQAVSRLMGVEAPLWTEYVPGEKAEYCTYPRLGAIAELGWTVPENRDYDRFLTKMGSYYRLLALYGVKPASLKQALPGALRAKGGLLWFNRRQLHWQGLHNLIDDAKVKRLASK